MSDRRYHQFKDTVRITGPLWKSNQANGVKALS